MLTLAGESGLEVETCTSRKRERRERFPTASSVQKSAGIAPVIERSGNKSWLPWRYSCSKFVRQTFVEWAGQTIPRSF